MLELPHLRRRAGLILALMLVPLLIGTCGYMLLEHFSALDALYMAVITVSTVGYQEMHPLSTAGRVFNMFVILTGTTALLLAVGTMTQTVIELELTQYFPKRRIRKMIESLQDHFIICGYGRVGRNAADELLRAGVPFIVLEKDEVKVDRAMRGKMLAALGDATLDSNLKEVGIARAKGLIATLATDADNLFLVLSAKALNPRLTISARVNEEEAQGKLERAGADTVLAPFNVTGSRLAQAILRPHVAQFLDFATNFGLQGVNIEQVRVDPSSGYAAKTLQELAIRRELGVIVLAIRNRNGEMLFNPDGETAVSGGDYLIAMGRPEQLEQLEILVGPR